jgi:hypothetical protein
MHAFYMLYVQFKKINKHILLFALKPIVNTLLSIEIGIFRTFALLEAL